jgi:TolB-like protein/tRNA A-37 threonylcarbamoyl transferase component Bud32
VSRSDAAALLPLAESIADGGVVDWEEAEARATTDEQAIIRQLRVLSNLAGLHRSLPRDGGLRRSALQSSSPAIGTWAHLTLLARLGGGAFGEVYRAWDRHLEREVALKLLKNDESDDDLEASRIGAEGRRLARVRHPNVITVHGVDVHDRRVGLWMELVRGATLEQGLQEHGPLSAREAALVGIDLCRALAAIHAAGLIHRDVKAQNVMREDGGRIVLMDLGTGRETDQGGRRALHDLAGTPLYLAPEIFDGAPASERTDLYSLGVLLYHLVTGSFPVRATSLDELKRGHRNGMTVRLRDARADLPTAFVQVIDRATATDPARRYETAGSLETALAEATRDEATPATAMSAVTVANASKSGYWFTATILAGLAALIAFASLAAPWRRWLTVEPIPDSVPGSVAIMAVLPFQNLSNDPREAYLANAVPMELISRLGQVGALKVVPWTFIKKFEGTGHASLQDVARRTGADVVVEGAVMLLPGVSDGSRPVQVRVQLFKASTGGLIWSGSFERNLGDFFALQGQIAREVAGRLNVVLAAREQVSISSARKVPVGAMEDYLNARQLLEQVDLEGAATLFLRAIAAAPRFAEAYIGLSSAYALQSAYFGSVPSTIALKRALDASNHAIAIDNSLAEAWASRAFARFALEWNWPDAESDFRRALELGPTSADVLDAYSNYLTDLGRHAEAIEASRQAEERAPLSAAASRQVAWAYYMAHQYDDAIQQVRRTFAIEPGYLPARTVMGRALLFQGKAAEGVKELEACGRDYEHMLALGYAKAGRREEAERLLESILSPSHDRAPVPYEVAMVYVALGDTERAIQWLESGFRVKDSWMTELGVDPGFDSIRADGRFRRLLLQMGLR